MSRDAFDCHLLMKIGHKAIWTVQVDGDDVRFSASSWEHLRDLGEVIAQRAATAKSEEQT